MNRHGLFLTIGCVPFPYCGPLVPIAAQAGCIELVRRYTRRRQVLRTVIQFAPGTVVDERALIESGFNVNRDATYVVDTSVGADAAWPKLGRNARSKINHTRRAGIEVRSAAGTEVLDRFEDATFTDRGIRTGYATRLSQQLELLSGPELRVPQMTASRDGQTLGVLFTLASEHEALAWVGGVLPEHRSTNANYLLHWDAIRWACEERLQRLDMVGVVNPGIAEFKKQFGGVLTPYISARLDSKLAGAVNGMHHRLTGRS